MIAAADQATHANLWSTVCVIGVILLIWGVTQVVRGRQAWKRPKPFALLKTGLLLLFLWMFPYYFVYFVLLGYIRQFRYFSLVLLYFPLSIASRNLNPWHVILVTSIILIIAGSASITWQAARGLGRKER